jgi:hypothetical protein
MQRVPWDPVNGPSVDQWMQIASAIQAGNSMGSDQLQASCPPLSPPGDPATYCFCAQATLAGLRVDFSYPVACKTPFPYSHDIQLVPLTGKRCEGCTLKAYKKGRTCSTHAFRHVRQYLPVFRERPYSAAGHKWKQVSGNAYAESIRGWWFCKTYGCALFEVGPVVAVAPGEQPPVALIAAPFPAEPPTEAGGNALKRRRPALRALAGMPAGGAAGMR